MDAIGKDKTQRRRESIGSRLWRIGGNLFPAYRRSGARVIFVSSDFYEVHIKIPSNWRTRNHLGITWGGGLYAAIDPIYGVMLQKILGHQYRVVDKRADIHFKKPVRETLYVRFCLSKSEVLRIRTDLEKNTKTEREYQVFLEDKRGVIHAHCYKKLSIQSFA